MHINPPGGPTSLPEPHSSDASGEFGQTLAVGRTRAATSAAAQPAEQSASPAPREPAFFAKIRQRHARRERAAAALGKALGLTTPMNADTIKQTVDHPITLFFEDLVNAFPPKPTSDTFLGFAEKRFRALEPQLQAFIKDRESLVQFLIRLPDASEERLVQEARSLLNTTAQRAPTAIGTMPFDIGEPIDRYITRLLDDLGPPGQTGTEAGAQTRLEDIIAALEIGGASPFPTPFQLEGPLAAGRSVRLTFADLQPSERRTFDKVMLVYFRDVDSMSAQTELIDEPMPGELITALRGVFADKVKQRWIAPAPARPEPSLTSQMLHDFFYEHMRSRFGFAATTSQKEVLGAYLRRTQPDWLFSGDTELCALIRQRLDFYGARPGETAGADQEEIGRAVALSLTSVIDWNKDLRVPSTKPGIVDVRYDSHVFKGLAGQDLGAARAAAIGRIAEPIQRFLGLGTEARGLAAYLLPVVAPEPTLSRSFSVPVAAGPHYAYGTMGWAELYTGMTIAESPLASTLTADSLRTLGRAAIKQDLADASAQGTDSAAAVGDEALPFNTYAILLMADVDGAIALDAISEETKDATAKQLEAFVRRALPHQVAFAEALDTLAQPMPLRAKMAENILRERGINPDEKPRGISLRVSNFNSPRPESTLLEVYMSAGGSLNDKNNPELRSLPALNDLWSTAFNAYRTKAPEALKTILRIELDALDPDTKSRLDGATFTLYRPSLQRFQPGASPSTGTLLEVGRAAGVHPIAVDKDGQQSFYLFKPFGNGAILTPVPADNTVQFTVWMMSHKADVFPPELLRQLSTDLGHTSAPFVAAQFSPQPGGTRDALLDAIAADFTALIDGSRDTAYGATLREQGAEIFKSVFIPFYAMIQAARNGDVTNAIISGLLDAFIFLPVVGQTARLAGSFGTALAKSAAAAVRTGLRAGFGAGVRAGLRTGVAAAPQFLGQGGRVLGSLATALVPVPLPAAATSTLKLSRSAKLTRLAATMRADNPRLAEKLSAQTAESRFALKNGMWTLTDADLLATARRTGSLEIGTHRYRLATIEGEENVLLKEQNASADTFTLADPKTGSAYGPRLTVRVAGDLHLSDEAFASMLKRYEAARPANFASPGRDGISRMESGNYITIEAKCFRVRYDRDNATWRIYRTGSDATPYPIPVRFEGGRWRVHNDVGLRGGGPCLSRAAQPEAVPLEETTSIRTLDGLLAEMARLPDQYRINSRAAIQACDFDIPARVFRAHTGMGDEWTHGLRRTASQATGDEYLADIIKHTGRRGGSGGNVLSFSATAGVAVRFTDPGRTLFKVDTTQAHSLFKTAARILLEDADRLMAEGLVRAGTVRAAIGHLTGQEREVFYLGGDIPAQMLVRPGAR